MRSPDQPRLRDGGQMAANSPLLVVLWVQQAVPALTHHGHEAGDGMHQAGAAVPYVQLHHRGKHF